ncbi:MAG: type II toxin-antitoxin system Phd/YefM family antitoxin [Dehalococcoidia bacterium]
MTTYTYSEARQKLASLLDQAQVNGEVLIKRKDGSTFVVKPISPSQSPLDVEGIDLDISAEEIIDSIRETRSR